MDICSQIGLSATDKINDHDSLCMNTFESIHGGLKALYMDELNVNEYSTFSTSHKSCKTLFFQDGITSEISEDVDNIKANDLSGFRSISLPLIIKLSSMDICSQIGLSATDKINDHHNGLCMNTFESIHGGLKALSVDELNVDECSTSHKSCEFQEKDSYDKLLQSKTMFQSPEKCLVKHATFPSSGKTLSLQDGITSEISEDGDNIKANDLSGFRSISLPTLVSAMKGSREKRGAAPPVKLTVKWAPEVYDPIRTSVSHVVTNNRSSSKHSKKNSKNKQKHGSKSSRGSKSKDRKQVRKRTGSNSSGTGYKLEHEEQLVDFHDDDEPKSGGIDFHVGNHDQYCGSSFMKKYGTDVRLSSVAEAT